MQMFAGHSMYTEMHIQYLNEHLNRYVYIGIFLYDLGKYCIIDKELFLYPHSSLPLKKFIFSFKTNLEAKSEWAVTVRFAIFNVKFIIT